VYDDFKEIIPESVKKRLKEKQQLEDYLFFGTTSDCHQLAPWQSSSHCVKSIRYKHVKPH